jgi:hypothetical protein
MFSISHFSIFFFRIAVSGPRFVQTLTGLEYTETYFYIDGSPFSSAVITIIFFYPLDELLLLCNCFNLEVPNKEEEFIIFLLY